MTRMIPGIRPLCDESRGEYWQFDAAMAFLMEVFGEDAAVYDYTFFAGITGDCFTQLFREDYTKYTDCLSEVMDPARLVGMAFGACGYDYELVSGEKLRASRADCEERLHLFLDTGLPVLAGRAEDDSFAASVVCGCDEDGFYVLQGGGEPQRREALLDKTGWLVFPGEKYDKPTVCDLYLDAVVNIPYYMMLPPRNGLSFGRQAFRDWADSLTDGRYVNADLSGKDTLWKLHGAYLRLCGANAPTARRFLRRAMDYAPDAEYLSELESIYERQGEIYERLRALEGGYDINEAAIRDPVRLRPVAAAIREAAACCDDILTLFDEI